MTSICIELKTECKYCSNPIMINALVEDVQCHSCQKIQNFSFDSWRKTILASPVEDGFKYNEGEGQAQTIMSGEYTFHMTYGKLQPQCQKCKTPLDESKFEEYAKSGKAICEKCKNEIFVRAVPDNLKPLFPGLKYLAGEDKDMIPDGKSTMETPQAIKPILFTCPSCAGNLKIDGKDRIVTCNFCNSEIYLPDDLWLRMHPVKVVDRWYLVYAPGLGASGSSGGIPQKLQDWYHIPDVTIDKEGNVYVASCNSADFGGDIFSVWSFSPDMKMRWARSDLKYSEDYSGISLTNDGNLFLWDRRKFSLTKLSSKDGSTLETIKGEESTKENPYSFNLKGCGSLLCDSDGTILALINNEIVRYNESGKRIPLWEGGFISGIFGEHFHKVPKDEPEYAPYIKDLHSHPSRCASDYIKINLGWDGYMYFSSEEYVAKYDHSGKQQWKTEIGMSADSKACTDSKGNVYVLGMKDDSDRNTNLVRISPNGKFVEKVILDLLEGGYLESETELAVAYDGTIYAFNYYNRLKVFSPDFKRIYISEQSAKDDAEALKKKKDKIDNDEEK